jgi:hypothetical protein
VTRYRSLPHDRQSGSQPRSPKLPKVLKVLKLPKVIKVPPEDVQSVLVRARQVDPGCEETAIRGYLGEILEAEAVLDAANLSEIHLSVSFSASWEDERGQ